MDFEDGVLDECVASSGLDVIRPFAHSFLEFSGFRCPSLVPEEDEVLPASSNTWIPFFTNLNNSCFFGYSSEFGISNRRREVTG